MARSIRVTLLAWFGAILFVALTGMGAAMYVRLRQSMLAEADAELRTHAAGIAGALQVHASGHFELQLSDAYHDYFNRGPAYFALWDGQGRSQSTIPAIPPRPSPGERTRGDVREVTIAGPGGTLILVGTSIQEKQVLLAGFLRTLAGSGFAILVLALAGGAVLARWSLAPVARIGETAASISASELSRRIDVSDVPAELAPVAKTLNEAFDRLEQAFGRQARFTGDASHELRTPLSILMTQMELALRKRRSADEYEEMLTTCVRAARRMQSVIEGLLMLARADAKELNLAREQLDLKPLVEEAVAEMRPLAAEHSITLGVHAETTVMTGDRDRWRDVVTNLVTNAIRYNKAGGRVDVTLKDRALTVADTGIGIPEADQPHVFERFYRVDKARSRDAGGTGLGLAIAKSIVEAHGGAISFTSREGTGTTFVVRLPA